MRSDSTSGIDSQVELRTGVIVNLHLVVVITQTQGDLQTVVEPEVRLMIGSEVQLWCVEIARHPVVLERQHAGDRSRHAPLCHDKIAHLITKKYGSVGMQPLIRTKHACGVLPTASRLRAEHQLLRQGVHLLLLLQTHIVCNHIVLVHIHSIPEILVTGGRVKNQRRHIVGDVQTSVDHLTAITVHRGR